jgi:hypothetical protein
MLKVVERGILLSFYFFFFFFLLFYLFLGNGKKKGRLLEGYGHFGDVICVYRELQKNKKKICTLDLLVELLN